MRKGFLWPCRRDLFYLLDEAVVGSCLVDCIGLVKELEIAVARHSPAMCIQGREPGKPRRL